MSDTTLDTNDLIQPDLPIIPGNNTIALPIAEKSISSNNNSEMLHENKSTIAFDSLNRVSLSSLEPHEAQLSKRNDNGSLDSSKIPVETISESKVDTLDRTRTGNNGELDDLEEENASVLVIILQCETKSCDDNIINLKWVFSNPYFTVQVCAVDPPTNIATSKTLSQAQYLENYSMRKALTYAAEGPYVINQNGTVEPQFWWTKIPCIIVKDSSVSNIIPIGNTDFDSVSSDDNMKEAQNVVGGMKRRIQVALDRARQADLFFLCKWNDACNKYIDVNSVGSIDHGSTLKWSIQPTSTQAIMYTPSSRDYIKDSLVSATSTLSDILNSNISKGRLVATVFVPNIIDFDIDLATSNEDYAKLSECAPIAQTTSQSSNVSSFIWLAIIIALVILVAWL